MNKDNNNIFHNHSMLEELKMDNSEKTQKRFGVKYIDNPIVNAPVGHIYSVMVEELGIKNPNLKGFINELNVYIETNEDGFACINNPTEHLYDRTISKFFRMLQDKIYMEDIEIENAKNIMFEATGNCDCHNQLTRFIDKKLSTKKLPLPKQDLENKIKYLGIINKSSISKDGAEIGVNYLQNYDSCTLNKKEFIDFLSNYFSKKILTNYLPNDKIINEHNQTNLYKQLKGKPVIVLYDNKEKRVSGLIPILNEN